MNYYNLNNGAHGPLRRLIPQVAEPQFLSPEQLEAQFGIVPAEVRHPSIEWYQTATVRNVDDSVRPVVISWAVVDRDLESVRSEAWERMKQVRVEKRTEGVEYTFHDGTTGHIQIRDEDISNLLAIHAAATTALMTGNTEAQIPFTDAENVTRVLNPTQALSLAMAAFAHGSAVHVRSQQVRAEIFDPAKTTAAQVAGVEW